VQQEPGSLLGGQTQGEAQEQADGGARPEAQAQGVAEEGRTAGGARESLSSGELRAVRLDRGEPSQGLPQRSHQPQSGESHQTEQA